jgi:imidazole glycerol phosphate synthase subunit HisF
MMLKISHNVQKVSNVVNIPVIAHGGPGSKQDILELLCNSDL